MSRISRVAGRFALIGSGAVLRALLSFLLVTGGTLGADARSRRSAPAEKPVKTIEKPSGPLVIVVSIGRQRVAVYSGTTRIAEAPISSGQRGYPTPQGVFTILGKERMHFSNLYGGAPMPFMERITWSGVAMHAGDLPGYPASHGCIRLPYSFARDLFGITSMGARVIVTTDAIEPANIEHVGLITPLPSETAAESTGSAPTTVALTGQGQTADASGTVAQAPPAAGKRTREQAKAAREAETVRLGEAVTAAEAARLDAVAQIGITAADERAAKEAVGAARRSAEPFERDAEKAKRTERAAEEEIESFVRRANKASDGAAAEAGEREKALEDKHLALAADADAARAKLGEVEEEVGRRVAAAAAAAQRHKEAIDKAKQATAGVKAAQEALANAKRVAERLNEPVSVFVSRKAGRVYVRQGQVPIGDFPVTIEHADESIGTHVFTALSENSDKASFRWTVASIATPTGVVIEDSPRRKDKDKEGRKAEPVAATSTPAAAQTAVKALERVQMPQEARDLVAEFAKPGSSLVISDYGISNETGKYTDFIVLTKVGEPGQRKSSARGEAGGRPYASSSGRSRRYRPPPDGWYW